MKNSLAASSASQSVKIVNGPQLPLANGGKNEPLVTWVHKNFQVFHLFRQTCLFSFLIKYSIYIDVFVLIVICRVH